VGEWQNCDQDRCSDHSIIRFAIGQVKGNRPEIHFQDFRYRVQKSNIEKFQANLFPLVGNKICKINKQLDTTLLTRAHLGNVEKLIEEFYEVLTITCNESFRKQRAPKRTTLNRSVPRWTEELTTTRKRLNALRLR
jgi:dephospho-CoA kinase